MPLAALLQARPSAPSRRRGGTRTQTPAQRRVLLAYIGLNAALDVVWLLTFGRSHPGLVRERLRPGPGAKEGFLKIFVLYGTVGGYPYPVPTPVGGASPFHYDVYDDTFSP